MRLSLIWRKNARPQQCGTLLIVDLMDKRTLFVHEPKGNSQPGEIWYRGTIWTHHTDTTYEEVIYGAYRRALQ